MDEFGIGVGLYYRQLLTFAIVRLPEQMLSTFTNKRICRCDVSRTCVPDYYCISRNVHARALFSTPPPPPGCGWPKGSPRVQDWMHCPQLPC